MTFKTINTKYEEFHELSTNFREFQNKIEGIPCGSMNFYDFLNKI